MSVVPDSSEVQGRIAAGRLLTLTAGKVSESIDHFAGWLLSGFGAAYALILANIENVVRFLDIGSVRTALGLFAIAIVAGVVSRFLGAIVSASAAASADAAELGRALEAENPEAAVREVLAEIEKATLWPARIFVAASFRNLKQGDYAVGGRLNARLAQIQSWFVLLLAFILIASIWMIARGLAV